MFKLNNKDTRTASMSVSIVDSEQINVCRVIKFLELTTIALQITTHYCDKYGKNFIYRLFSVNLYNSLLKTSTEFYTSKWSRSRYIFIKRFELFLHYGCKFYYVLSVIVKLSILMRSFICKAQIIVKSGMKEKQSAKTMVEHDQ